MIGKFNYSLSDIYTIIETVSRPDHLLVSSVADLPVAVAGIRTLPANTLVEIAGVIDLGSDALVLSAGTVIRGLNPGGDGILTLNTGGAIRATNVGQVILREFFIASPAGPALALTGPIEVHCNLFFVGFLGCLSIGTITGFKVAALEMCYCGPFGATLSAGGITFAGTSSKIFVFGMPFEDLSGGSAITLAADVVCDVVDVAHSFFKYDAPAVGLTVTPGATVGRGLFASNLFPAVNTMTPLVGLSSASVNWRIVDNNGLRDSRVLGSMYISSTAITAIATQNIPVKIAGTTTPNVLNERFSHTNNRLTYTGEDLAFVEVLSIISIDAAANNKQFTCYITKNGQIVAGSGSTMLVSSGTDVRSLTCATLVELSIGDYVEVWVENDSDDTDLTVTALTVNIH